MLSNLKWSDTDNFYMNLGCHKVINEIVARTLKLNIICVKLLLCSFSVLFHFDNTGVLHKGVGLVVCGDDKGSLWLYNMPTMVQVSPALN